MTSFCECNLCQELRKKARYPLCKYCKKHHDPRLTCPERIGMEEKNPREKAINTFILKARGTKYEKEVCPACDQNHKKGRTKCPDVEETIKTIFARSCEYYLDIADGKYTVYQEKNGTVKALRYGEPWRDLCGDNLIFYLMVELIEAKEKIKTLEIIKGEIL